jgi:hypothetical protein
MAESIRPAVLAAARALHSEGVYPSRAAVARRAGCRRDTVTRHRRALMAAGDWPVAVGTRAPGRPGTTRPRARPRPSALPSWPPRGRSTPKASIRRWWLSPVVSPATRPAWPRTARR